MENELEPGLGGQVSPAAQAVNPLQPETGGHEEMLGHFDSLQDQANARFQMMKEHTKKLDSVRKQLDELVALGDTVNTEALVKSAAVLVSSGFAAAEIAGLLADAPESGEALQSWVAEQDQRVTQQEKQSLQALAVTRHELGLTAMRHLIGASAAGQGQSLPQTQPAPPAPPNQLSPEEPL